MSIIRILDYRCTNGRRTYLGISARRCLVRITRPLPFRLRVLAINSLSLGGRVWRIDRVRRRADSHFSMRYYLGFDCAATMPYEPLHPPLSA